jgi:ubiquinone/menaquinone biosynthesis C-methylase UbiE
LRIFKNPIKYNESLKKEVAMNKSIENLLYCPSSKEKLKLEDGELFSQNTSYPLFEDVPWLFKDPEYSFLEWGTKIESYIKEEDNYIKHLQSMTNLNQKKLTRQRLSKIQEAKSKNLKVLIKTLEQFRGHKQIPIEASTQQIHSYFQLIFRDWSWDSEENITYNKFVEKNIPKDAKNILVLGCGAGNLSYELATKNPSKNIISLDHNPFLVLTAQKIFNGEEVKLSDYTNYPKSIESTSKNYKIKNSPRNLDNHQFVLGSFPNLPFQEQSFDMIIAPWFFDILDFDFCESVSHSCKFLKPNGTLSIFGPNNIHKSFLIDQQTSEEIAAELSPQFESSTMQTKQVKYLHNPISSQNRLEDIMFFSGVSPKFDNSLLKVPVKNNLLKYAPTFEHYKAVNETFFNILKHVNDDITVEELGIKLEAEFGFKTEEAYYYAQSVINKIISDIGKV